MTLRRSRIRPKRRTPRRRTAPRWTAEEWTVATVNLLIRDHGRCPVCAELVTHATGAERHHRMRRRDGGDRYSNLLLLHPDCHAWVTTHPEEAHDAGLIVWTHEDPETVPVRFYAASGAAYLMADDGTRQRIA